MAFSHSRDADSFDAVLFFPILNAALIQFDKGWPELPAINVDTRARDQWPDHPFISAQDKFANKFGGSASVAIAVVVEEGTIFTCLLYTSPSPRDATLSRMPSSA